MKLLEVIVRLSDAIFCRSSLASVDGSKRSLCRIAAIGGGCKNYRAVAFALALSAVGIYLLKKIVKLFISFISGLCLT